MSEVKLISHTTGAGELEGKSPQDVISFVARVSNPHNQENYRTAGGLLKYCIKHQHWSIFETASMTLEINTNRGIAAQVLRHRSFCFQEFSQRYADTKLLDQTIPVPNLRRQDNKNRQNSLADLPPGVIKQYGDRFLSILMTLCIFTTISLTVGLPKSALALFFLLLLLPAFI